MLGLDPKTPVLVVAAHHDDEVLGCGATIARLTSEGHPVTVAILGEGPICRDVDCSGAEREAIAVGMRARAEEAAQELGATFVQAGSFPDNAFDSVPLIEVVRAVEQVVREVGPQLILTHHAGDLNIDHAVTARAVQTAARPLPGSVVNLLLAFEVVSSSEWPPNGGAGLFAPDLFVDVSEFLGAKLAALGRYEEELCAFPHPRSKENVWNLAGQRGAASGARAAEAFEVIRWRA